jgi:hypothetical protein
VYGSRFGLPAGYEYPGDDLPVIFPFDTEASSIPVQFITPGLYEEFPDAVAVWRSAVGDTAGESEPELVELDEDLKPPAQAISERDYVLGTETRATTDNWFRAARRIEEIVDARLDRGDSFPLSRQVWHSVSPARINTQLAMFKDDWVPDGPMTPIARALFPDWVRWNGEQADLPDHLIERAVDAAK